jgi:hypothetical protein
VSRGAAPRAPAIERLGRLADEVADHDDRVFVAEIGQVALGRTALGRDGDEKSVGGVLPDWR